MSIDIRKMQEADKEYYKQHLQQYDFEKNIPDCDGYAALYGGEPIGFLTYEIHKYAYADAKEPRCVCLYAEENFIGIGKLLTDYWERDMLAAGYDYTVIQIPLDEELERNFEHLGYSLCGVDMEEGGDGYLYRIGKTMGKRLKRYEASETMAPVLLSADGDASLYYVPKIVAAELKDICNDFYRNFLSPENPQADKYRIDSRLEYDETAFIEYLNRYIFPERPSYLVKVMSHTERNLHLDDIPHFNF